MQNITIGRYDHPQDVHWFGWVEPADKSWIMFIPIEGPPQVFCERDSETGAVYVPAALLEELEGADGDCDGCQG